MFKKKYTLFIPKFWFANKKMSKFYIDLEAIPYPENKSTDKPFTIDSKGQFHTF